MSINKRIEEALSGLAEDIWPMACPLQNQPDTYITYNPETEGFGFRADDRGRDWAVSMQVHYFTKGNANVLKIRKDMAERLEEADFAVGDVETFYESDTGFTHVCLTCSTVDES